MFVNGSINEARIQESMATCLRGKRQAERQYSESVSYKCYRSEEHTSELQSRLHLVCRLLLEKKKKQILITTILHTLTI